MLIIILQALQARMIDEQGILGVVGVNADVVSSFFKRFMSSAGVLLEPRDWSSKDQKFQ